MVGGGLQCQAAKLSLLLNAGCIVALAYMRASLVCSELGQHSSQPPSSPGQYCCSSTAAAVDTAVDLTWLLSALSSMSERSKHPM